MPFAHAPQTDSHTGQTHALLRGDGFDPLIIEVNTSTEYWQKGASLLHTDLEAQGDLAIPDTVRLFLMAGTQHGGRAGLTAVQGNGYHPRNPHNPTPALRALLVALEQWVVEGVAPPTSRIPTLADGSLVRPDMLAFPVIPGILAPEQMNVIVGREHWVYPESNPATVYHARIPQVDAGGNEIAGIRLPPIAVPRATYTGWNLYRAPCPKGELCDREGSYLPFAASRVEREASGDPRPSLEERYRSRAAYVKRVEAVAQTLVDERLLLPQDAARYVDEASSKF